MTDNQYNNAISIYNRLKELDKVKREINNTENCYLTFAKNYDDDYTVCYRSIMNYISSLLDKHDIMIRKEIDDEILKLKNQIERL